MFAYNYFQVEKNALRVFYQLKTFDYVMQISHSHMELAQFILKERKWIYDFNHFSFKRH